jgi:hypothetical protein
VGYKPKLMKKIFLLIAIACISIVSCNLFSPYGKAVKINDSLEVYIKGDSTTEADAKKLGNYLAELWKENTNHKSIQLQKDQQAYIVRMVADEKVLKTDPSLESVFSAVRDVIEENVFPGSTVKLILTNEKFEDIKVYKKESPAEIQGPSTTRDSTNSK